MSPHPARTTMGTIGPKVPSGPGLCAHAPGDPLRALTLRGDLAGSPAHQGDAHCGQPEARTAIREAETTRAEDLEDAHREADEGHRGHHHEARRSVERLRAVAPRVWERGEGEDE